MPMSSKPLAPAEAPCSKKSQGGDASMKVLIPLAGVRDAPASAHLHQTKPLVNVAGSRCSGTSSTSWSAWTSKR